MLEGQKGNHFYPLEFGLTNPFYKKTQEK